MLCFRIHTACRMTHRDATAMATTARVRRRGWVAWRVGAFAGVRVVLCASGLLLFWDSLSVWEAIVLHPRSCLQICAREEDASKIVCPRRGQGGDTFSGGFQSCVRECARGSGGKCLAACRCLGLSSYIYDDFQNCVRTQGQRGRYEAACRCLGASSF